MELIVVALLVVVIALVAVGLVMMPRMSTPAGSSIADVHNSGGALVPVDRAAGGGGALVPAAATERMEFAAMAAA